MENRMKSALQERAETAAARFNGARKPIVIEFAGVPKAGKTSTLGQIQAFLKRCGFRVEVVIERASVCPIRDKKHANFNIWTACTTLSQILEKTQTPSRPEDPHVLILDRGLFDAVSWLAVMERLARIRPAERQVVEEFLLIDDWRRRITGVIVMTTSPRDSMEREKGYLPVEGAKGSIMNEEVLQQMLETTRGTAKRLKDQFRIFEIDTSTGISEGPQRTAESVAEIVLSLIEEQLEEEILFLPSRTVDELFAGATWVDEGATKQLMELFATEGHFKGREAVESDETKIQALPVVIVRNKSGHVLRLKRKEQSPENPLHEKLVIWAGGHVRREDGTNGRSIVECAVRELQEELRLSIDAADLRLLGAVRALSGGRTQRHVAIVFEWRAATDDVAVALSSAEFFERRGTSLSGSFVDVSDLAGDIDSGRISEPWSTEIVRHLLPEVGRQITNPKLV
jgi:predicted NUDIX family phosphoesterase